MGKRAVFLVTIACCCFFIIGCGEGKGKKDATKTGVESTAVQETAKEPEPPPQWEGEYLCKQGDGECRDDKLPEGSLYFAGTVFNTVVTSDVNARTEPSSKAGNATVIGQIRKDTKVQILGVSRDGWAFVTTREPVPRKGWISGQFLDYREEGQKLTSTEMKVTDFNLTSRDSATADLTITYKINNAEKSATVKAFKKPGQNFFTFFYDIYAENSHYSIIPGLYTWNFSRNQLRHSAFLTRSPIFLNYEDEGESAQVWKEAWFSDDLKFYFVNNFVDGCGGRAEKHMVIFQANGTQLPAFNIDSFDTRAKTITGDCPSDEVISKHFADTEAMDSVIEELRENYRAYNELPNHAYNIRVLCEVNLETGARKILETRLEPGGC